MSTLQPPLRKLVLFWMTLLSAGLLLSWPLSTLGEVAPGRSQTLSRGRRPGKATPPAASQPAVREPVLADDPPETSPKQTSGHFEAMATAAPSYVVLGFN